MSIEKEDKSFFGGMSGSLKVNRRRTSGRF
jgi:hypothetical protein